MDEKQRIIQEIRRVAEAISPKKISISVFKRESKLASEGKVRYHFGSWNNALKAAGLEPNVPGVNVSGYEKIPDDELLAAIGELWKEEGRKPTRDLMNSKGKFSNYPYKERWGSFTKAVDAYVQQFGEPDVLEKPEDISRPVGIPRITPVVVPKTHKPSTKAVKKRTFYGEPIDFRGLRYAPVNEQGVVYLFGVASRELGFLIESIRTDFPDCEGKRCLDPAGAKWEHVRIEFEYKSSNFAEHGHDPDGCDLIVCWIHDWQECPLEVLELKSEISRLPKG